MESITVKGKLLAQTCLKHKKWTRQLKKMLKYTISEFPIIQLKLEPIMAYIT